MKLYFTYAILTALAVGCSGSGASPNISRQSRWSVRIADSFLERHPGAVTYDTGFPGDKWTYEQGVMLVSLLDMWQYTGDEKYFDFVRRNLEQYIGPTGSIRSYRFSDFNLDNICPGRALLAVYQKAEDPRMKAAADTLRCQLQEQPRTHEGGFWHKKIYPDQMWLDGLFMAEPFYAMYASLYNQPAAFDDIANQFIWIARHTKDPRTGLLYHAWDETKSQKWSDPVTGCSPSLWGRAMGWYAMGLVDVLDYFPPDHPRRGELITLLRELSENLLKVRDEKSSLWYQVVDQGSGRGNYLESSSSGMFAYVFAKGARMGYLDPGFADAAREVFKGILDRFVTVSENGLVNLQGVCAGAGLGGTPYRDGSFGYYVSVPQRQNDMKGIAPLLRASIELERIETHGAGMDNPGRAKTKGS